MPYRVRNAACLSLAALLLTACGPTETPETSGSSQSSSGEVTESAQPAALPDEIFYCDSGLNGRHYFYLDPANPDIGIVGFEFSPAYRLAFPDEAAPTSEMQSAISASGMRYANEQMEFHAKGQSGFMTLSDGTRMSCELQDVTRMPGETDADAPGGSLSFEWSANGFETLPEAFKWEGGGGETPGVTLAIPETDNFVWISQCDAGAVKTHLLLTPSSLEMGEQTSLQFETDKTPLRTYPVEMGPLPFGDGADAGAMSPILVQSIDDPMFTDLTQGEWAYFQVGEGDDAAKLRVPLWGAISAWNAFIPGCRAQAAGD